VSSLIDDSDEVVELFTLLARRKLAFVVLRALNEGPLRYTMILHTASKASRDAVHNRTLTNNLKILTEQQLVEHHQDSDGADYRLTAGGAEFVDLLDEISRWHRQHCKTSSSKR
jgi:DNA-binding HxlR family transcriptional regulator